MKRKAIWADDLEMDIIKRGTYPTAIRRAIEDAEDAFEPSVWIPCYGSDGLQKGWFCASCGGREKFRTVFCPDCGKKMIRERTEG